MLYKALSYIAVGAFTFRASSGATHLFTSITSPFYCPPDEDCLIRCDKEGDEKKQNTYEFHCGNATQCEFDCEKKKCHFIAEIYGENTPNLIVRAAANGQECFKDANIYTPHNGNAYFYNGGVVAKGFKGVNIFSQPGTQSIILNCDGTAAEAECADVYVNASNAQFLRINVGDSVQTELELSTIMCPVDSNYKGPEIAPCIIDATNGIIKDVTIEAPDGIPKGVWIPSCAQCDNTVTINCDTVDTLNGIQVGTSAWPFDQSSDCWWTKHPTYDPTIDPTTEPTTNPTAAPTQPTVGPTDYPTRSPTNPTLVPSKSPTDAPSAAPTNMPSSAPSLAPSSPPTNSPTLAPSNSPTNAPSDTPSAAPTNMPSSAPSLAPSSPPTNSPTLAPSNAPTNAPSDTPSAAPSRTPSIPPTAAPSFAPTDNPTNAPSLSPSRSPTSSPTAPPTRSPTTSPTNAPSGSPTTPPTRSPSESPSGAPSAAPSDTTASPSAAPSFAPTNAPSSAPTFEWLDIWFESGGRETKSEWTRSDWAYFDYDGGGYDDACTTGKCILLWGGETVEQQWIYRATDVSLYHMLRLKYDVTAHNFETSDACQISYAYDNITDKSLGEKIEPVNASSSVVHYYKDSYFNFPPATDKNTIWVWLETFDGACCPSEDLCFWDNIYLQGVLTPTQSPTSAPSVAPSTPPTNVPSAPSQSPTVSPTDAPSVAPSSSPTDVTASPSAAPSLSPTNAPSVAPSTSPSNTPSTAPTDTTASPSAAPSFAPTNAPSSAPTFEWLDIWFDDGTKATKSDWTRSNWAYFDYDGGRYDDACTTGKCILLWGGYSIDQQWIYRSTDISLYHMLRLKYDVTAHSFEASDACQISYAYNNITDKSLGEKIEPANASSSTVHYFKDRYFNFPAATDKNTIWIWLETFDGACCDSGDLCFWDDIYLQGVLAPTPSPTSAPSAAPTDSTASPSAAPSSPPTNAPSSAPTPAPSDSPSNAPTLLTLSPSVNPTPLTLYPTISPTQPPTFSWVDIWFEDGGRGSKSDWTASDGVKFEHEGKSKCTAGKCILLEGGETIDQKWIYRSTDISLYYMLRLKYDVTTKDFETSDACQISYAYDNITDKSLGEKIEPVNASSSTVHYFKDRYFNFPSATDKNTVWVWLETFDGACCDTGDLCYWDSIYLQGVLAPTPSPTSTPTPPTYLPTTQPTYLPTTTLPTISTIPPTESPTTPPTTSQEPQPPTEVTSSVNTARTVYETAAGGEGSSAVAPVVDDLAVILFSICGVLCLFVFVVGFLIKKVLPSYSARKQTTDMLNDVPELPEETVDVDDTSLPPPRPRTTAENKEKTTAETQDTAGEELIVIEKKHVELVAVNEDSSSSTNSLFGVDGEKVETDRGRVNSDDVVDALRFMSNKNVLVTPGELHHDLANPNVTAEATIINAQSVMVGSAQMTRASHLQKADGEESDSKQSEGVDLSGYLKWNGNDIVDWMVTLEKGQYKKYEVKLRAVFKEEGVCGQAIPFIDKAELKNWGVTNFLDRSKIHQHLQDLISQPGCNDEDD